MLKELSFIYNILPSERIFASVFVASKAKGEFQNEGYKTAKHAEFSEKRLFLTP